MSSNLVSSFQLKPKMTPRHKTCNAVLSTMAKEGDTSKKTLLEIKRIQEFEELAKSSAKLGINNYACLNVLNRCYDSEDVVVEDSYLVEQKIGNRLQYTLSVIELKDELAVTNTLREIHVLQQVGINKYIMSLYAAFRHRQYIAMVFPAFVPIRNLLDVRYQFKNNNVEAGNGEARLHASEDRFTNMVQLWMEENYHKQIGLFTRDSVAYVTKKVTKGLDYIHSKGFAHTELCANNVYIDFTAKVKVGGFLHAKKLGSKSRKFTGDPNSLPPESLDDDAKNAIVEPSLDYWSLGLLTLELITGKRHYLLKEKKAKRLAHEYLDGVRNPPTLASIDPTTVQNGAQKYDEHVENFISKLLNLDPKRRMTFKEVLAHPFISKPIERKLIKRELKMTSDCFSPMDGNRTLFHEIVGAQGSHPEVNGELLLNVIQGIRHVEKDDYPLFSKVKESQLCKNYVAIEASVAIPYDDSNWSRDVLDVSQCDMEEEEAIYNKQFRFKEPLVDSVDEWDDVKEHRKRNGLAPDFVVKAGHPNVNKEYQRYEVVFFVKKEWSPKERQIFIAMQFGRWYQRGVIHFTDLIRVVDEIEEVMLDYVVEGTRVTDRLHSLPDAVYFASPRREIRFDPYFAKDLSSRYLQHIYVDVGIHPKTNQQKVRKFEELMEGDPIEIPEGLATLQASVCFQDLDPEQFENLEAQMIGQMKVVDWDFDEEQHEADATRPETKLYRLLYERRRNYNNFVESIDNDGQYSNQARCHKIWGDFARDYLIKLCKWAIPYRVNKEHGALLYGDPFSSKEKSDAIKGILSEIPEELDKQLTRTRIKQEEDAMDQYKRPEDVELRQKALEQHHKEYQGQEGYFKLGNQLARSKAASAKTFDPLATPAARGTRRILKKY